MWKNIDINENLVKARTDRSVLIAMPHKSDYDGYKFWHPAKLVRDGRMRGMVSIGYTDEFDFRLKKYGNGKYNSREVLDEITLAADDIETIYKGAENDQEEEEPLIYSPQKIEPENATADESLIDYE